MVLGVVIVAGMVAALVTTLGVFLALREYRDRPGVGTYRQLLAVGAGWIAVSTASFLIETPTVHYLLEIPHFGLAGATAVIWVAFALSYTGRGAVVTRRRMAVLSVVPLVTVVLIATNSLHGLMWSDYTVIKTAGVAAATYSYGPWFYVFLGFSYLLIGFGLAALFEVAVFSRGLYAAQSIALVVAAFVPTITNLAWTFRLGPIPAVNLTPMTFTLSSVLVGYALFREDLFELVPATQRIGTQTAIDDFGDGVVIVDTGGMIVDANAAAERVFGRSSGTLIESQFESLLDAGSFDPASPPDTVAITTDEGRREYSLSVAPVENRHGRSIGYTVTLHDVTEEKHRQQRLAVLNRLLRHNLRNTMSVVVGSAEFIETSEDGRSGDLAGKIVDKSTDLVDLSEKTRRVDEVIGGARSDEPVDLRSVLQDIADEEQEVTIRSVGTERIETDRRTLEETIAAGVRALRNHADAADPTLVVDTHRAANGWLTVEISGGAGIPEAEQRVVTGGAETALEHASGLDLWLVSWGTETLGGDLSFDADGIVLTVPAGEGDDEPAA